MVSPVVVLCRPTTGPPVPLLVRRLPMRYTHDCTGRLVSCLPEQHRTRMEQSKAEKSAGVCLVRAQGCAHPCTSADERHTLEVRAAKRLFGLTISPSHSSAEAAFPAQLVFYIEPLSR